MKSIGFFWLVIFFAISFKSSSQPQPMDIIVNEIYNESQNEEWTEILVVKDNVTLAGFYFSDNNAATNSWQPKIRFNNNLLWQRLRAGTYILINHAASSANCNQQTEDTDKSDGYIRVCAKNTTYFTGGTSTTLNIASDGDFVHLVDPNGRHVHGLGFDKQPGQSVEGGPPCKDLSQSWLNTTTAEDDLRPCNFFNFYRFNCPSQNSIGNLSGQFPADFNSRMNTDSINSRIGILTSPTPGQGNSLPNQNLIASWREPQIDSQTVCARTNNQGTSFSWRMAIDPVPSDNSVGYLILKAVGNNLFPFPSDGRLHAVGDTLRAAGAKAVVLAIKNNSLDTTHLDASNIGGAIPVFYSVFAFRYTNTPGVTSFDRGRAYNTTQFVKVSPGSLQAPTVSRITDPCAAGQVTLQALPNIQGAIYEWRPRSLISFPVPGVNGFEYSFPAPSTLDSVFVNYRSSAQGCVSGVTKFLITPVPVFTSRVLTSPAIICPGDTFEIFVNGASTSSYFWQIPGAFSMVEPILVNSTRIKLVAQSSLVDSARFEVKEQVGQCIGTALRNPFNLRPKPDLSISGDTIIQYGSGTSLTISTNGLASWLNEQGGLISNSNTLLINALGETTTYIAKTEIINSTGCVVTKNQKVSVFEKPVIVIPNVITPQLKDGKNDLFVVKGGTFKDLQIFNRWGKRVFEAGTYNNNWAGDEPGMYFYEALLDDGFKSEKVNGYVQVLK